MLKHIDDPNRCVTPPSGKEFTYCGETVDAKDCIDPTQYEGKDVCSSCEDEYRMLVEMLPCGND